VDTKNDVTPIQATHPEHVDPNEIRLFREPPWALRMTIEGDRSYLRVKVVRAAPLSDPTRYICFLDAKDEIICTVRDVNDLDAGSRRIVEEELDRRYMIALIERIYSAKSEFGASYWDVETDRGRREFVIKDASENVRRLDGRRMLLVDVDGNRFEIRDLDRLDKKSLGFIETVL
jgi:hypothetical protein